MFRLIDIYAVLVMQRQELLSYYSHYFLVLIIQLEIEPYYVAFELPAKTFDIEDVLDEMEELIGELETGSVCHGHIVTGVQSQDLRLDMRFLSAIGISDVRLVVQLQKL